MSPPASPFFKNGDNNGEKSAHFREIVSTPVSKFEKWRHLETSLETRSLSGISEVDHRPYVYLMSILTISPSLTSYEVIVPRVSQEM